MALSPDQINAITFAVSPARMGTYLNTTGFGATATPVNIYVWNALVSGAFFSALHIAEVVMRNAVSQALELKYGSSWAWDVGFERSLPQWSKCELRSARQGIACGSTGKVIAELKFAFWCSLFTTAQEQHIWNAHLRTVFPFLPFPLSTTASRKILYDDMEALRRFRNRIAHHEPIIAYPLSQLQDRIRRLINARCDKTANWLSQWEVVSAALAARP